MIRAGAALLLLGVLGTVPGCARGAAAGGCTPPPHEDAVLVAYRADAVFGVRPPEAVVDGGLSAGRACRHGEDTTTNHGRTVTVRGPDTATTAHLVLLLNLGFTPDELTDLYDPTARREGWTRLPSDAPTASSRGDRFDLLYCKAVAGVPTMLDIAETWLPSADRRAHQGGSPAVPEEGDIGITMTALGLPGCIR